MITPQQLHFLRLLGKTGFLTNTHLNIVKFSNTKHSKHYLTKRLLDEKLIGRVLIASPFGIGRKVMYFLTHKGAEMLSKIDNVEISEISYSPLKGGIHTADNQSTAIVRSDFSHKESYISAFLAFEKFLESTDYVLADTKHYYQLVGDRGTTLSLKNRNFRPDGIWICEGIAPNSPTYIYVVEVHRHSERKHIIRQLRQQVEAIKEGCIKARFNTTTPHFVLSIFSDENTEIIRTVIEELRNYPEWQYIQKFFMFAKLDDLLNKNFRQSLAYFDGIKKPLPKDLTI